MLTEWLGGMPVADFLKDYFGGQPYSRPESARGAISVFTWDTLDRVLEARPEPDVLVIHNGRHSETPPPRSLAGARELLAKKQGLVVRRAEKHDVGLRRFADAFAEELAGRVHLQLFVTRGRTHGFGWHYDAEDVFIVQTQGIKKYFFRKNTVATNPSGSEPDFTRVRYETSPLMTCTLIAGDWLYLPKYFWHVAQCVDDSLSISIGVTRP